MNQGAKDLRIAAALGILVALGFPKAQQNKRSALCLLALLDLTPKRKWANAQDPVIGITPIMDWIRIHYGVDYKPNTRETIRRQSIHQFRDAGLIVANPDALDLSVNSPRNAYRIETSALALLRTFGTGSWDKCLKEYLTGRETLIEQYAQTREQLLIPVVIAPGKEIRLSPGQHNELIKAIIEEFAPRFVPGSVLVYVGDTGEKLGYFEETRLAELGVVLDAHGKMPDVILHYEVENWLLLVESVTSHGPVDGKRHGELRELFKKSSAELVFVTAFPDRGIMGRYLGEIAWETEVWVADAPSHLIHFNGDRFLGPYPES